MSESILAENVSTDIEVHKPLERINYEAGMLLGLEATRAEQAYHRRRVNRLQYWFHGAGTLLGLVVREVADVIAPSDQDQSVRLVVSPGIAIDGLGRELLSYEPYCVNLRDWLERQQSNESFLHTALNTANTAINLNVTVRYHAAASGLQPVMVRKVNAGIDPVQPSRAKDGILLEIIPGELEVPPASFYRAGIKMKPIIEDDFDEEITLTEKDYFDDLDEQQQKLKALQVQLLYGIDNEVSSLELQGSYEELARVLLATIEIPIRTDVLAAESKISPIVHPSVIKINNLVRPFVVTPDQLTWLQQENTP